MKYWTVLALMISTSPLCVAQKPKLYDTCMAKAKTQSEMDVCANEEAERVEAERIKLYRALLSARTGKRESLDKLKTAENAWLAYRKAYLEAMYPAENKQAEYGSMFPMEVDLVGAELTQRHIAELRHLEVAAGDYMPDSQR
jgi:uncharacterized protein YecT (DUF1311 family)